MAVFNRFGRKKKRKYPIKRDEEGRSASQRCFQMFEHGVPAPEIVKATGVTIGTLKTYHKQWKKYPNLEAQHAYFKGLLNKKSPDHERAVELAVRYSGVQREELEAILQKPHGLRSMMMGKFYFPARAEADHKRYVALELAP